MSLEIRLEENVKFNFKEESHEDIGHVNALPGKGAHATIGLMFIARCYATVSTSMNSLGRNHVFSVRGPCGGSITSICYSLRETQRLVQCSERL
jgi:hypothetical protein